MPALLVGLNYHRIGVVDPDNPFHRLHTVPRAVFEDQIAHAKALGPFVSLEAASSGNLEDGPCFFLSFDDVSATVADVVPDLAAEGLPYHLCPTTEITRDGHGTRDKVNWILARVEPKVIQTAVEDAFGTDTARRMEADGFYRFTKSNAIPPSVMEDRIIAPLFEKTVGVAPGFAERAYLSWDDLRACRDRGAGIVNHSARHRRMDRMTVDEIEDEIDRAEVAFQSELGEAPADFAVPFGERDPGLFQRLDRIAAARRLRSVLWVGKSANLVESARDRRDPLHLDRLHTATALAPFQAQVERAIETARSA